MTDPSGPRSRRHGFRGTGVYWSLLVAAILGVAILIGIVQNTQSVQLRYLGWDARTPLVVALLITMFVTAVLTALVGAAWRRRRRGQLTAGAELAELRGHSVGLTASAPPASIPGAAPAPGGVREADG